jgi:PncC family amidohydrolase
MQKLAAELVRQLIREGILLATVESCTGGLIAHEITEVPGSSQALWGSWVTYSNDAKETLGVPREVLEKNGAVSPEVAREMALAGMRRIEEAFRAKGLPCPALRVIATTGIAGPGGGTEKTPVGLCYVALATSGREPRILETRAPESLDRGAKKRFFAHSAIEILRDSLICERPS